MCYNEPLDSVPKNVGFNNELADRSDGVLTK